ncbi:hypothetical protein K5I29_05780 [Flavobacterium agricola]|uniref:BlaR1 peptidase M56 n=1 Tax=Flavobacterium agricola TaxID=2870839 RepID=A0ABY6M1G4_9FLAO|nr:hypothetical protein [Flavobacterium agricola]UYW02404.1 hypothetical protein K5I29_05780 [Flavobacterium agricola]
MEFALFYLLKVNILLVTFWAIYRFFLEKESFYSLNRMYFIAAIALSFIAPTLFFKRIIWIPFNTTTSLNNLDLEPNNLSTEALTAYYRTFNFLKEIFFYCFMAISMILLLITCYKLILLYIKIQKLETKLKTNIKLTSEKQTIFSFYKWVVASPDIIQLPNADLIIQHEQIHIRLKHTLDLILIECVTKIFWFNPLLKLL